MKRDIPVLRRLEEKMQAKGYAPKTEHFYLQTIAAFLHFHGGRDPRHMGMAEIELFVAHRMRSAGMQVGLKQKSFEALFFFYTQVLGSAPQKEYIAASRRSQEHLHAVPVGSSKRKMLQRVMVF